MNQQNDEALHWIWSAKMQIVRFVESFSESIMLSKNLTNRENKCLSLDEQRIYSKASAEGHFLAISVNNLQKAMKKITNVNSVEKQIAKDIELLRNNLEHWDENKLQFENPDNKKIQSAKKYAEKFPNKTPWSFSLDSRRLIIGGILVVGDLLTKLDTLEQKLLSGVNVKVIIRDSTSE